MHRRTCRAARPRHNPTRSTTGKPAATRAATPEGGEDSLAALALHPREVSRHVTGLRPGAARVSAGLVPGSRRRKARLAAQEWVFCCCPSWSAPVRRVLAAAGARVVRWQLCEGLAQIAGWRRHDVPVTSSRQLVSSGWPPEPEIGLSRVVRSGSYVCVAGIDDPARGVTHLSANGFAAHGSLTDPGGSAGYVPAIPRPPVHAAVSAAQPRAPRPRPGPP